MRGFEAKARTEAKEAVATAAVATVAAARVAVRAEAG